MRKNVLSVRHDSRGMTLVELLMVMAILSVVMMAVMSLYIPIHQSTVAQTQVSDVQSNLRLALKTMSRDLLIAGFLVPNDPIAFPDATPTPDRYRNLNLDNPGTQNSTDFVIRTRAVGNDFARISNVTAITGGFRLEVTDPDMVDGFHDGSRVRLFEPISSGEVLEDPVAVSDVARAYEVVATGTDTIDINTNSNSTLTAAKILAETVVIRVRDENQPPLQTIRYRFNSTDGVLERIVNDSVQILARNVTAVNFTYSPTPEGRVNHVGISLTGKTKALKNDAISSEKTRAIETAVKLRNIN